MKFALDMDASSLEKMRITHGYYGVFFLEAKFLQKCLELERPPSEIMHLLIRKWLTEQNKVTILKQKKARKELGKSKTARRTNEPKTDDVFRNGKKPNRKRHKK